MADLLGRECVALQAVFAGMPGYVGVLRIDEQVAVALADGTYGGREGGEM